MAKKTSGFKKFVKWTTISIAFISLTAITFGFALYIQFSNDLPDITVLHNVKYQTPLKVYSKEGDLIAQFGDKKRIPVVIDEVPKPLVNAFVAAEDNRFFEHHGVDYKGLLRAVFQLMLTGKKKQGGSTITMQVTRNFLLTREKTYSRKIKEIILALKIEQVFSKNKILELYINKIFLGHHAYGVAAAAQVYYGKSLADLDLAEFAMIAGLPKAPSQFNPIADPKRAILRRNYILRQMYDLDFISIQEFKETINQPITAKLHAGTTAVDAPFIAEMVRDKIINQYGDNAYTSGLKVYTTLEKDSQTAANQALSKALHEYDERHGYRTITHPNIATEHTLKKFKKIGITIPAFIKNIKDNTIAAELADESQVKIHWENIKWARQYKATNSMGPELKSAASFLKPGDIIRIRQTENKEWKLAQVPDVEGAFVALNPANGAVLALSGGYDFYASKFNRAIQSNRQPGSGFKPIIYTAALEEGFTAASVINDAPVIIDDPSYESEWRPENYSRKFFGPTRLRTALRKSRNLISIRLLREIGIKKVTATALRFGFNADQLPNSLSLALGSGQATTLQMARFYAVFANGGFLISPHFIDRIETNDGKILFQTEAEIACPSCAEDHVLQKSHASRVISPQINFIMNSLLRDVVQRGTAIRAKKLGRSDLAGKTGTTNEQRDAWFNGYSSSVVASAWVGFDQSKPLGRRETGGKAALPMWMYFMEKVLNGTAETSLEIPNNIISVYIDSKTGLLAQPDNDEGVLEFFRTGYAPTEYTSAPPIITNNMEEKSVEELF